MLNTSIPLNYHTHSTSIGLGLQGNGLVVSTPDAVAGSIPAFCTCLFHVVPRVPGGAVDEKTGPVVLYGRIKPVLIVSIYSFIWARVRLLDSFNVL